MNALIESPKTAVLQIATGSPDGSKRLVPCELSAKEGRRLALTSRERVAVLTPVTLEYNDALFLGEIVACEANGSGRFDISIKIEQILTGLESLITLRERLLGAGYAHTPAQAATPVRVTRRV